MKEMRGFEQDLESLKRRFGPTKQQNNVRGGAGDS